MNTLQDVFHEIERLTKIDLGYKTFDHLYASTVEELGELSRELKIAHKVFGNTYKTADEGVKAEAIDLFICAACLYFADQNDGIIDWVKIEEILFKNLGQPFDKLDDFKLLTMINKFLVGGYDSDSTNIVDQSYTNMMRGCVYIFTNHHGEKQEFIDTAMKKLKKWEKSQNETKSLLHNQQNQQ